MTRESAQKPLLRVRFAGTAIPYGRILLSDLLLFISNLNLAIERTVNVLLTGSSIKAGRPQKAVQLASALEVVAIKGGCFDLALDLRRDVNQPFPSLDLGIEAISKLIHGLQVLSPDLPLPEGFDQGVLVAIREAGRILDHGIDEIQLSTPRFRRLGKINYNNTTRDKIISSIRILEQALVSVEGRLLMADVKEDTLRCRIYPSSGLPIPCQYHESLVPFIISNLRQFVRVRGEAKRDPNTYKIQSLTIYDIEPIEFRAEEVPTILPTSQFWEAKDFDALALEQNIYPIDDWQSLVGGFPEDADFDSFLLAIRSSRDN
jgi:hypothetical protein